MAVQVLGDVVLNHRCAQKQVMSCCCNCLSRFVFGFVLGFLMLVALILYKAKLPEMCFQWKEIFGLYI